jgi:hypothetical protein
MWTLNINKEKKLLIFRISGTLTLNELSDILKAIYIENDGKNAFYLRFVDMTDLKVIEIDFDTFSSHINRYRKLGLTKPDTPVKISLFIPENYMGGFPHLYKSMLSNDQFSIEISDSLEECAKYLAVDKKLLEDTVR